ncbi:MAG: hypothetical protein ACJ76I_12040 [Gaiellaceae bacterium]
MNGLKVSPRLVLPIDFVTKTCAILAQRRKGKTYTASVFAEELFAAQLPFVALDPTGAWWGLRASADGKKAGLPVVVLGGQHGDLPLERGAGAFVADLVVDHPGYYVLDLSLLDSRAAEREFATAFGERLYRRKMQPGNDFPLHLFVDEADMFVPQEKEGSGDVRMLGAYQAIVRRGGIHGLGSTLISQRPALVNKSVLTQLDLLVLLRLVAGQDQDAVDKNYISRSSSKEQRAELMESLASLEIGEAWFFEPGAEPEPLFVRVRIRERRTFNSSATPKAGEKRVEPRVLAKVDLDDLNEQMRAAVDRAKDNDPADLRKRLKDAQRELERKQDDLPKVAELQRESHDRLERIRELEARTPETIEVSLLTDDDRQLLSGAAVTIRESLDRAGQASASLVELLGEISTRDDETRQAAQRVSSAERAARDDKPRVASTPARPPSSPRQPSPRSADDRGLSPDTPRVVDGELPLGAARLLTVLAQFPAGRTRKQLAVLAGYKASGSTFRGAIAELRKRGYVSPAGAEPIIATTAGLDAAPADALPTGRALYDHWRSNLPEGARKVLEVLYDRWPDGVARDELAELVGYESKGSTFRGALAALRNVDLITRAGVEPIKAADELMEEQAA